MRRSWRTYSPGEINEAVERQQERQLAAHEAEQDRLDEIRDLELLADCLQVEDEAA